MALQDYYNTGDDQDSYGIGTASLWAGQSFTPQSDYNINEVKLYGRRSGSPGVMTVTIKQADGDGKPTGNVLASGTIDVDTIDTNNEWISISLGEGAGLSGSQQYVLYCNIPTASSGNVFTWRGDSSSPTYAGGNFIHSSDGGSSWTLATNIDLMFETWGTGLDYVELSATIAATSALAAILSVGAEVSLSATIAALSTLSAILTVPTVFKTTNIATIKRVVVAGNDEIWIEDI
ncbi:hypothetical protein LCGC14_0960240 [marine sediment metagenome]|uniref:Uncharacterized protein n=1 Tax=marine sediment metagenome TaxID=412755 RepID=A0A0F9RL62_9ZZZZ